MKAILNHRAVAAALGLLCAAISGPAMAKEIDPAAPGGDIAPTNLTGKISLPLVVYHMFSRADGKSDFELLKMPPASLGDMRQGLLSRPAQAVNIFHRPGDGTWSPWHTANQLYLVTLIQGEYLVDLGDGRQFRLVAGNMLYAEDWFGKGHRTRCEAGTCVLQQVILQDIDKSAPLRKP